MNALFQTNEVTSNCSNGQWSPSVPICKLVTCNSIDQKLDKSTVDVQTAHVSGPIFYGIEYDVTCQNTENSLKINGRTTLSTQLTLTCGFR